MLDFLFPNYQCLVCKGELNAASNIHLCDRCAAALPINTEPVTLLNDKAKQYFRSAQAPFIYQSPVAELIIQLKYGDNGEAAETVAPYMAALLTNYTNDIILVPVPLYAARQKQRGYNQSELLCNKISEVLGSKVTTENILLRVKETQPQKKMNIKQREENLHGAFAVAGQIGKEHTQEAKGRRFVLIDDVFTTGSTVNECAKALKIAGAKSIDVLTVARVPQF